MNERTNERNKKKSLSHTHTQHNIFSREKKAKKAELSVNAVTHKKWYKNDRKYSIIKRMFCVYSLSIEWIVPTFLTSWIVRISAQPAQIVCPINLHLSFFFSKEKRLKKTECEFPNELSTIEMDPIAERKAN